MMNETNAAATWDRYEITILLCNSGRRFTWTRFAPNAETLQRMAFEAACEEWPTEIPRIVDWRFVADPAAPLPVVVGNRYREPVTGLVATLEAEIPDFAGIPSVRLTVNPSWHITMSRKSFQRDYVVA